MHETPFGKTSLALAMVCTVLACGSLTTAEEGEPALEPGVLVRRPMLAPVEPAPEVPTVQPMSCVDSRRIGAR